MKVLTVNAGSSSLKLSVIGGGDELVAEEELPAPGGSAGPGQLSAAVIRLGPVDAVGHRIVHGGGLFTAAVRIDADVMEGLRSLTPLAPLHQPAALAAVAAVQHALPDVPAVACLDTAFHAHLPVAASTYALPREWRERHGIRRYGFHGLSHAYATRRTAELVGRPAESLRIVTCHLGAGASLAAVSGGRSVDTTMGFTPVEGLVMATRSGNVDPGLILWLLEHGGHDVADVADALEHRSGLQGLTGTADMQAVVAGAGRGEPHAVLARDVYLHRLRGLIAAMAAAMDGLDALVFTGGVGERSSEIRRGTARGLGFLGVDIDHDADLRAVPDADVSASGSPVQTLVVRAREDLQMAREVRQALPALPAAG